ncbi:MAG: hypothetical protein AAGE52_23575 [Myxococcota bacterium]
MYASWLYAFALTQLIEAPIYVRALRERPRAERWVLALTPSAFTHPLLWFVFVPLTYEPLGYWPMVALGELLVTLAEGVLLAVFRPGSFAKALPRALLWSLAANGTSVAVGFLSQWLFDWP